MGKIGREISAIIEYTVENKEAIGGQISGMINTVVEFPKKLPIINSLNIEGLEGKIDAFVGESLQNISKKGTELLASGVGRVALATPRFFVSLLVCFIASVYIAGDRENIIDYFFSLLNEKNRECCLKSNQKYLGRTLEVLVENFEDRGEKGTVITGRTRNNKIVHIPCDKDLTGEFVMVKITNARTWYLNGELI